MDNSSTRRRREIETLSLELRKYPTDLLHSFLPTSPNTTLRRRSPEPEKEEDGEILNLGLSLGGRFGVDKTHKGLVRSSSVAGAMPLIREEAAPRLPLVRTASLPTETEEECRRWKELQSLRSMEAKRKRSEKQRGINENGLGPAENLNLNPGSGYPVLWAAESVVKGGFCDDLRSLVMQQQKQDGSQGSDESQGGSKSSSNASETDIKTHPGSCSGTRSSEVSSKKQLDASNNQKKARICGDGIGDMPCVFTVGDGPRGRKVEGILYRYKKGEEVRIMCVCHGSFFTPAEFVNHAGARNVAHPLKRIVVNPTASPFS